MLLGLIQIRPLIKHIRRIHQNRQRHDRRKPSSSSHFVFLRLPNIPYSLWTAPGRIRRSLKGLRVDDYAGLLVGHSGCIFLLFFPASLFFL
ncbi:hypothetical protein BDV32DRAFT_115958 [Aspergillus pseudonomiae]|uniref:Uncharacterized protein n=1 Tax=Aspergillus pseudonomiae TaxID=1506151 RepID=A0A5N6IIY9_9EURO|nr:uncharacterized protein BDV37DRAFT_261063 [Aspergillus pseudonomiae]KAB8265840.1 hypothetical protein BDV32DRAFT_115958 [Aspergillus pseudonomiae]KAE8399264.1 hypothetical protein BDV37DRAFT_261063 [Aspergillus pseudonomiae]